MVACAYTETTGDTVVQIMCQEQSFHGGRDRARRAGRRRLLLYAVLAASLLGGCRGGRRAGGGPGAERPRGVVVYVLDSGVDPQFVEGEVAGYYTSGPIRHGSLVARVIRRRCRSATIHSLRAEDPNGEIRREDYRRGLRDILSWMDDVPTAAVLVNISLGSRAPDAAERELIARLTAKGALIIAAAGNEAADTPFYPAGYEGVVAVAAANDRGDGKDLSSNYGRHIDLAAKGGIEFTDTASLPGTVWREQVAARGTSFAAPKVTGTLAEMLTRRKDLTPREAVAALRRAATAMPDDPYFRGGLLGSGLLNEYAALAAVDPWHGVRTWVPVAVVALLVAGSFAFLMRKHGAYGFLFGLFLWVCVAPVLVFAGDAAVRGVRWFGEGSAARGFGAVAILAGGILAFTLAQVLSRIELTSRDLVVTVLLAAACVLGVRYGIASKPLTRLSAIALGTGVLVLSVAATVLTVAARIAKLRRIAARPTPAGLEHLRQVWRKTRRTSVAAAVAHCFADLSTPGSLAQLLGDGPAVRDTPAVRAAVREALRTVAGKRKQLLVPYANHEEYGDSIRELLAEPAD